MLTRGAVKVMVVRCLWVLAVVFLLLPGCTSEKSAVTGTEGEGVETTAPAVKAAEKPATSFEAREAYAIEITPPEPTRDSMLSVKTEGFKAGKTKIEWMINGSVVAGTYGHTFPARDLDRGDRVVARAMVNGKEVLSRAVEIGNAAPEVVKARIIPEAADKGERMRIDAEARDADGDLVNLEYEWTKNGEVAGDGEVLETPLRRGDRIAVKVTPSDPWNKGRAVEVPVTIRNVPPVIRKNGGFHYDGRTWTYKVTATDPDGDPMTYSLNGAPSGMTIDRETGAISWPVPADFSGDGVFTAVVRDDHGGESKQDLSFTITK